MSFFRTLLLSKAMLFFNVKLSLASALTQDSLFFSVL